MSHRVRINGLLLLCVVVAGGCGRTGDAATWPSLEAPIETLAAAFAACPEASGDVADAVSYMEGTAGWLEIGGVVSGGWNEEGDPATRPATVEVLSATGSGEALVEGDVATIEIHDTYWPGIDWALANEAGVWFGLVEEWVVGAEDVVGLVAVTLPDGRVFLPGECQHSIMYEPMAEQFGEAFDSIMNRALGLVGHELAEVLHPEPEG